jgi:hypothetical protein
LPISVATGTTTPAISIAAASTTAAGAVQLNDTLASTSTTQALTDAQGKVLKDQIDTLLVAGTIELAGTIDASAGLVASVTSVGTADGYTVGSALPAASSTTNNTYVIVTTPGTLTPPGGVPTAATRGDWFLVSETSPTVFAWTFLNVGFDAPAASDTVPGIVELATNAETATGTDATKCNAPRSPRLAASAVDRVVLGPGVKLVAVASTSSADHSAADSTAQGERIAFMGLNVARNSSTVPIQLGLTVNKLYGCSQWYSTAACTAFGRINQEEWDVGCSRFGSRCRRHTAAAQRRPDLG